MSIRYFPPSPRLKRGPLILKPRFRRPIWKPVIRCGMCGKFIKDLDEDRYGPEDWTLCRRCHEGFYWELALMLNPDLKKPDNNYRPQLF